MRPLFALLVLLLAFPMLAGHAEAVNVSSCSTLNSAGTFYTLTQSITKPDAGPCMHITANNIVFDCQGYRLESWDGGFDSRDLAVNVTNVTNATVKNCRLTGWYDGIRLSSSNNSGFENNTAWSNLNAGIELVSSSNNTIVNNNISDSNTVGINLITSSINNTIAGNLVGSNSGQGIQLTTQSANNTIRNNTIGNIIIGFDSARGISLIAPNNTVANNTIESQSIGIAIGNGNNSIIANNTIRRSGLLGTPGGGVVVVVNTFSSDNLLIANNTLISNSDYGIQLVNSSNAIVRDNAVNASMFHGIFVYGASSRTIATNNTIVNNMLSGNGNSGGYGVFIQSANNNTVLNNTFSNNSVAAITVFNSTNTTINNSTLSNETNGIVLVRLSNYSTLSYNSISNISTAIWIINGTFNSIRDSNISRNNIGTKLDYSHNNSIVGNTYDRNPIAIKLTSSENNTIENNTFSNNGKTVHLDPSPNNSVIRNVFRHNGNDIADDSANIYENNIIYLSDNSSFIRHNREDTGTLNSLLRFNFTVMLPNGSSSSYTLNSMALYPSRSFLHTNATDTLFGNFTPADGGINTVVLNLSVGTNLITVAYPFLIGGDIEESVTYSLRDISPAEGKPRGFDANNSIFGRALRRTAPASDERSLNATTHILSIDEAPITVNNVRINQVNSTVTYKSAGTQRVNVGFQRIVTHDNSSDSNITLPASSDFVQNTTSFDVNWTLDTPGKWTKMAIKLIGRNVTWKTNSTHPSNMTLRYQYAASAPKVFNITSGAKVLSSASNSSSYVMLVIDGDQPANLTVQMPSTSTYTIHYDNATCASPTCNATQTSNNVTLSLSLGSIHTVELIIPTTATTTTTTSSGGGSLVDVKGNVVQSGGIPTVDEQASTTSVPPSSVPARPGEYTISEDGVVILLEGNLTEDNKTLPGTVYLVGYPQSPFIVGGIVKSDPLKYGSLPQRAGFATKALTSYDIEIKSGVAYLCMNYRGFENPESVRVYEYTNYAWRELPREHFANNLTTSTACGTVKGMPYMVAGFVSSGTVPVTLPVTLPTAVTSIPLVVYVLGALAAVVYFAYRFRSGKKRSRHL